MSLSYPNYGLTQDPSPPLPIGMDKVCGPPFEVTVQWYLFYIRLNKQVSKTQLLYVDDSLIITC